MANTTISPNMNLPVPVPGQDPGVDWANNIVTCLGSTGGGLDGHDHSPGKGVQITPAGININADLSLKGNNETMARSVRFSAQGSPLALASDLGCIYESGVDLWYNDGNGNQVRLTQGGNPAGGAGSITGLPSGTASASYAAGTFTWQSATNTPAAMNMGPIVTGAVVANSKTWTIQASSSQASNLVMTLPLVQGAANTALVNDGAGNMSWSLTGSLPLGSVIATFPNLTGAYTTAATTAADANGFVLCQGQTIADVTSPMNGQVVPNINSSVFLLGNATAGTTGGSSTATLSTPNLPSHTHTWSSTSSDPGSGSHTHNHAHYHQWNYQDISDNISYVNGSTSQGAFDNTTGGNATPWETRLASASGSAVASQTSANINTHWFTSGALTGASPGTINTNTGTPSATVTVTGTNSSTGSGSAFSIIPPYISAVYLMRIK